MSAVLFLVKVEEEIKKFKNILLAREFLWDKSFAQSYEYAEK
jgi:hypothetical protein